MITDTKQKLAVTVFGAVACAFLLLGVFQLKSHLRGPVRKAYADELLPTAAIVDNFSTNKDTDGDGLSDFEEQTLYNSSAYLSDSDSDGIQDGQEVKQGKNPACPEGKECLKGDFGFTADTSGGPAITFGPGDTKKTTIDPAALAGDISPQEIRDILIKGGAKPASLEKVTDEQLQKLYRDTLASSPDLVAQKQIIDTLSFKDMTALRAALKSAGAPPDVIDKMSDGELRRALEAAGKE